MKTKRHLLFLLLLSVSAWAQPQKTIKLVPFIKNQVISVDTSLFTVTEIQFSPRERIQSIQNGDIAAWTVDVSRSLPNTFFIKPTLSGSNTNMTVMTNLRTYYFHLNSDNLGIKKVYAVKFYYPKSSTEQINLNPARPSSNYHWDYSFHGSRSIMPLHVFDDNQFTYFQLRPRQVLPAIFSVDNKKGEESIVNFRREGNYLVIHRLAPQFTLRSGKHIVASIFNKRLIEFAR